MKIHQFYTYNDLRNFTYIIELDDQSAIVIDPWDAEEINKELSLLSLTLKVIINTHEHWDHVQGNKALVAQHRCEVWAHNNGRGKVPELSRTLSTGESIQLDKGYQLKVLDTPGHTFAHLCFIIEALNNPIAVFTGDTLFNAGVGHCRSGNEEVLYKTISEQFQVLNDDIVVYPGHDYLENNLRFTLNFEPDNLTAQRWLVKVTADSYQPGSIQTTIGDEKTFNTFLRLDNLQIRENLALPTESDNKSVFLALRSKRDHW